jgi:hypothetical protein
MFLEEATISFSGSEKKHVYVFSLGSSVLILCCLSLFVLERGHKHATQKTCLYADLLYFSKKL